MSGLSRGLSKTNSLQPRLGIFVDCKPLKEKVNKMCLRPHAPASPPVATAVERPARSFAGWGLQLAVLVLAPPFLVLLTAVAVLLAWRVSAAEPTAAAVSAAIPESSITHEVFPVAHQSKPVLPSSTLAPAAEVKGDGGPETHSAAQTNSGPPSHVEPVKVDLAPDITVLNNKPAAACATEVCKESGKFCGTAVAFVASPRAAGEQAIKQHKLLFVLHVSGNFEDPGFT
jgi:hypothetical protein